MEPGRAGRTRIDDELTANVLDQRPMRMPIHDDVRIVSLDKSKRRGRSEFVAMTEMDPHAAQLQVEMLNEAGRTQGICISAHRMDRGNRRQRLEDVSAA